MRLKGWGWGVDGRGRCGVRGDGLVFFLIFLWWVVERSVEIGVKKK